MSYRRVVLAGWSKRDWLAVLIVAVTAAFIAGTTLMLLTTSSAIYHQTASFDSDTTVEYLEGDVVGDGVRLPVAAVERADGTEAIVVGVPADAPAVVPGASLPWREATLPDGPPAGQLYRSGEDESTVTLAGDAGSVTRGVLEGNHGTILPPGWYVADTATVRELGRTGTLQIQPRPGERSPPSDGVVVTSAVPFLLAGARDILETLSLVALAGGVLAGVAVYSLTRISVLERMRTFFVIRSTGGDPLWLLGLITLRGGLLALVGVAFGGALGVGAVKGVAVAATAMGAPVTVDPALTGPRVIALGAMLGMLLIVGALAGLLAGLEAIGREPARLPLGDTVEAPRGTSGALRRLLGAVTPRLLGWRALAPTTASLTVFVTVVLVATSVSGAFTPLYADGSGSITDSDAPHLLASRVDVDVAEGLRSDGVEASPEILLTQVRDGEAYLARGVDYDAFAGVANATLVAGRRPAATDEAVIGADLAGTLGVSVGETLTVGGGTSPGVRRVHVVGAFRADGLVDDQLLLSLPAARHLGNVAEGQVTLVRTRGAARPAGTAADDATGEPAVGRTTITIDTLVDGNETANATGTDPVTGERDDREGVENTSVVVAGIDAPRYAAANTSIDVEVTLRNVGAEPADHVVASNGSGSERRVTLAPEEAVTVSVAVEVGSPGGYRLAVAGYRRPVAVFPADALRIDPAFQRVPTNATLKLTVVSATGTPVENATVKLHDLTARAEAAEEAESAREDVPARLAARAGPTVEAEAPTFPGTNGTTNATGVVRLPTPAEAGNYTLLATAGNRSIRPVNVTVSENASRRLVADLHVAPTAVLEGRSPTADLTLTNPWSTPITRNVTVEWARESSSRTVTVDGFGTVTVETPLTGVSSTGRQSVNATAGGRTIARSGFVVVDAATAYSELLDAGGIVQGSALGGALQGVLGDLRLLQITLVLLAAGMVTGSTATAFAQAVHARRRTVGVFRATGASPWRMLRLVFADATRLGVAATLLALPLAFGTVFALQHMGYLTLFGVRFVATASPTFLAGTAAGSIGLALLSAGLATAGLLRGGPVSLMSGRSGAPSRFARRMPTDDGHAGELPTLPLPPASHVGETDD